MTRILAWHWCAADKRLGYDDGREVKAGATLLHKGAVRLCGSGLHASTKIIDALRYAPGPIICRVRLSGDVERGGDKLVASERHTLWMVDASRALILWAADCAWTALQQAGNPDPRSVAALQEIVRQQRSGVRDAERLAAARTAAWTAARTAAWTAASDAASGAASDAASGAAWDAACGAAWDAARTAASDAARTAAWTAASDAASGAAWTAACGAAWDAARTAASDAAWDAQSLRLRRLIGMERRGEMDAEIARLCVAWGVDSVEAKAS